MSKTKTAYVCQSCEAKYPHWAGQCSACGEWNTLVETVEVSTTSKGKSKRISSVNPVRLSQITTKEIERIPTKIEEFDRVLGGKAPNMGFVPGQVVLLAGTPGIGKSTILTQLSGSFESKNVLYVCGEESINQVKVRAERMGYKKDNLLLLPETNAEVVVESIYEASADDGLGLIIVDSIQTLSSEDLTGMAGSVGQVRGSTQKLINAAKSNNVPLVLVGHVTKEGTVAGPKVLEHMVDTVLYLEGDSNHMFRILRTTKNRFGPVSEVGIFEMKTEGMVEVKNPSKFFLSDDPESNTSGSCVTVVMEGFRPILVEVQALTVRTSFGYPKRTASGYSINRLHVLLATLEKRCGLKVSEHDVYISISGGYKISEYSTDLAVCLAVASSLLNKPVRKDLVAFGECDLSGGVRNTTYQDIRINEAKKLGYKNVLSAAGTKTIKKALSEAFE